MGDADKKWGELAKKYRIHIQLERGMSANTIESYMRDLRQFEEFVLERYGLSPVNVEQRMVEDFLLFIYERGVEKSTQARMLSGIKSFYHYLLVTDVIDESPVQFIEHPSLSHTLPDTLSVEEIDLILDAIDLSAPQGRRNRAMVEMLYSCGLRVSELVSLRIQDLFFDEGFIRVTGKGNKQRLVPVSGECRRQTGLWLEERAVMNIDGKSSDVLFLNRRGGKISRVMVFNIIKAATEAAGIRKDISPHTFRHSFATHLLQGGASIRQVQELLGHESITTTEIYTHLDSEHLSRTLDRHHPLGKMTGK